MKAAGSVISPVGIDDAALFARLHADCFADAWSEAAFRKLLETPGMLAIKATGPQPQGFAMAQIAADSADVVTLGVLPEVRRSGIGLALLEALGLNAAMQGARELCLEVSVENAPALALYRQAGFQEVGRRADYYRGPDGRTADALILRFPLMSG